MHDSDFNHQSSHINRRFVALAGIGAALVLILGVLVFNARAGILSGMRHSSTTSVAPAINLTRIHNECHTPPHKVGDATLSIHSGGLIRTFILVFPQGVDNPPSWNAGVGTFGPTGDADDVQFTHDLFNYFEHNYCVDTHRIYVTGYSLGGGMAYRIACTLSNQIAAFATVAGAFYTIPGGCNPSRPIPVLEIHGQADQFAPYDGNAYMGMAAVQTYLNFWLIHDKCNPSGKVIFLKADATGLEWSHCAKGTVIQHYRISDGGHVWPGSNPTLGIGYNSHTIDASVVIWNFLSQFSNQTNRGC